MVSPPRIRMSHTWTGSTSSWTSRRSHRRLAHHMAMTSRRSLQTTQRLYAICLLNSARWAAVSFFRVVTLALAVGLVFQMTGRSGGNLPRCSLHPVSLFFSVTSPCEVRIYWWFMRPLRHGRRRHNESKPGGGGELVRRRVLKLLFASGLSEYRCLRIPREH